MAQHGNRQQHGNGQSTAWQLRGICMATAWQLHGNSMATAWQLHGICMEKCRHARRSRLGSKQARARAGGEPHECRGEPLGGHLLPRPWLPGSRVRSGRVPRRPLRHRSDAGLVSGSSPSRRSDAGRATRPRAPVPRRPDGSHGGRAMRSRASQTWSGQRRKLGRRISAATEEDS